MKLNLIRICIELVQNIPSMLAEVVFLIQSIMYRNLKKGGSMISGSISRVLKIGGRQKPCLNY